MNSPYFDISETEFGNNANLTLYLAAADISNELSANPISRADVFFSAGTIEGAILESAELGAYVATSENGLLYTEGEWQLWILPMRKSRINSVFVPYAPDFTMPTSHTLGTNVTIGNRTRILWTIVVVIRADTGEVTYEKRPTDVESLYEFAHPNGVTLSEDVEYVTTVEIPAQSFPNNYIYVVAMAGIRSSGPSEMIDVNPLLSSFISGKFNIEEFCVPSCESLSQIPE